MRIGIHVSVSGRGDNAVDELVQAARNAHAHGLDFWTAQLFDIDALTALAVVGREVPGLGIGTAVVPTYPRHPMVMAMQALTVQAASGGRLSLGIGLSHQMVIEGAFGLSFSTPVRHMREYLEILMPLLHTGQVTFEGEEYTARTLGAHEAGRVDATSGDRGRPRLPDAEAGRASRGRHGPLDGRAQDPRRPHRPTITKAAEAAGRPAPRDRGRACRSV